MLDDIEQQDDVVVFDGELDLIAVQIELRVAMQRLVAIGRRRVHAMNSATFLRELLGESPLSTAEIEHVRSVGHIVQRHRMRRRVTELQIVGRGPGLEVEGSLVEDACLVVAALRSGFDHIPGVAQPIDVADLVTVIGGDRDFDDPQLLQHQLDDDLCVEVKLVRVELERDLAERLHRVGAVAGVGTRSRFASSTLF